MKRNLFTLLIAFLLIFVLAVPVFASTQAIKTSHWSQKFIDELKKQADIDSILKDNDLNSFITIEDFQNGNCSQ